jgi:5-methylcytosine-specific restriction enzyme subunit McrC
MNCIEYSRTTDKRIFIKNIYYMLAYAFQSLNCLELKNIAAEEFDNIHDLFAAILGKGIGQQLKRGLYREYCSRKEDLPGLRGKIDMTGTIRQRLARKPRLSCEYGELSENNLLNQILKTTAMLLLRNEHVRLHNREALKKEMLFFSDIGTLDPAAVKWADVRFDRNSQAYRMLLGICRMVLEGMLLTTDSGAYRLASFLDDQQMSRLYEKFILEYYKREWPDLRASAAEIPWALGDGVRGQLPAMQSDVTLSLGETVLIIDAKFYSHAMQEQYGVRTIQSHNLYQIFTYVKNRDAGFQNEPHTVSGMLLYARTDEDIQPGGDYLMSGSRICVKTLDLNCEFSGIADQLDQIVSDFFSR